MFHRMGRIVNLFVVSIFLCSGCVSAVDVHRSGNNGKEESVSGIPFYVKKGVCKQTTTYAVYKVQATLTKITRETPELKEPPKKGAVAGKAKEKQPVAAEEKVVRTDFVKTIGKSGEVAFEIFKKNLKAANKGDICYDKVIEDFKAIPDGIETNDSIQHPIANSVEMVSIVDYSTPYYLNAKISIFGNSTLNGELNPDGTLSKASSAVAPGATEALSTLLPIKEVLSTAAGLPIKGFDGGVKCLSVGKVQFELQAEKVGNIFEFTDLNNTYKDDTKNICRPEFIDFNYVDEDIWKKKQFTVKPLEASKKEDNSNKITVSGDIVLPKSSAGK